MGVDSSAEGSSSSGRRSIVLQSAAAATSLGLHVPDLELFFPSCAMSYNNNSSCSSSSLKPRHSSSSASSRSRELPVFYSTTPARHSSASASAVSPNGRYGRRMTQHNSSGAATAPVAAAAASVSEMLLLQQQSSDAGNSFRSEDSRDRESLALWEEKGDCQLERLGRKSRWVKKLESISQVVVSNSSSSNNKQGGSRSPWRNSSSSPMQQHALTRAFDSPRSSIDRKLLGPSRSPWRDLVGSSSAGRSSKANIDGGGASTHDSFVRTSTCSSPRISSVSCDVLVSKSVVVAQASRLAAAAATCIEIESQERDPLELGSEFRRQKQQLDIDAAAVEKNQTNNSRRPSSAIAWDTLNKSPELSPLRAAAAIPFSWEEVPGKPKTIAAATERALARRSSQGPMKTKQQKKKSRSMDESMFNESLARVHEEATAGTAVVAADHICRSPLGRSFVACAGDGGDDRSSCKSSHRFYYYRRTTSSKQNSSFDDAHSSGRLETTAGVIDLVAPAAAKFLASSWSPVSSTSPVHPSSMLKKPAAVPFKWEESPGKPFKEEELLATTTTTTVKAPQPFQLQLPPCLAPAAYQKLLQGGGGGEGGSMSQQELREHCINHSMSAPLAGFYTSSAAADHQGPAGRGGQHRNLPAKLFLPPVAAAVLSSSSSSSSSATTTEVAQLGRDSSSSSPQHRWSWSPVSDIGLTMITPKFIRKQQAMKKLVSQTLSGSVSSFFPTEEQQQQQEQQRPAPPRGFSSGEFTSMMMQKHAQPAAASSPTSTLHGPDTDSQLASSSLSSDLDARSSGNAANPGRMCSNSNSTASDVDSCSFECQGDFESSSSPRTSTLHSPPPPPFMSSPPPHDCSPPYQDLFLPNHHHTDNNPVTRCRAGAFDSRAPAAAAAGGSSSPVQALIKLCKSGSHKLKFLHRQKLGTIHSPGEVWSSTPLATYYQWKPSAATEESEAPQKSSKAAATALPQQQQYLPDLQCSDLQLHHAIQKSESHDHEQYSTRLPYMMHSDIKKQMQVELAATGAANECNQLSPNPDFNARLGEKPFSASRHSCSNNEGSMSPAYTATLELLSPAAVATTTTTTIVARKSKKKLRMKSKVRTKWSNSAPKVHIRARFLVLVCNAIKRMLSRTCSKQKRQQRKTVLVSESKLLYHVDYTLSPTDFHLSKLN
ncbi:hypothetical protein CY35_11G100400 [Sphagnum magellanicum]|nr:hypothetical protein CY35_11G100400 [Sphagnum magellanicum]